VITVRTSAVKRAQGSSLLQLCSAACIVLLPLALLHARAVAEMMIGLVDAMFLLHCCLSRDWAWLRAPWVALMALWCGWVVLCAMFGVTGAHGVVQAVLALRLPLFAAALGDWALDAFAARRTLHRVFMAGAAWVAFNCWLQYLFGWNLFGMHRWVQGELTGPFYEPRAGSALFFVLLPATVPIAVDWMSERPVGGRSLARRAGGVLLMALGVLTMVLIGQRMPLLLTVLALVVTGLLLRRLRVVVVSVLAAAAALIAALPVLAPVTFHKLVIRFAEQMGHFGESPYGLLYIRSAVIALAHPWLGVGYDGFRGACLDPQYFRGLPWLGIPDAASAGADACNIHPHNFYAEAAVNAGAPGLLLFALAAIAALGAMARGLRADANPRRVALFATALGALWPLASTNDFYSVPNVGWLMLLLGWGLAEANAKPVASASGFVPGMAGAPRPMAASPEKTPSRFRRRGGSGRAARHRGSGAGRRR
jgi:O-antigen ligase